VTLTNLLAYHYFRLSDVTLGNLLSVKSSILCGEKFNVKMEEIRFVGFPVLLDDVSCRATKKGDKIRSFNIAFVLQVRANVLGLK